MKNQKSPLKDTATEFEKESGIQNAIGYEKRYEDIVNKYHEKRENLAKIAKNATNVANSWKMERSRAIQAASRSCLAECPTSKFAY